MTFETATYVSILISRVHERLSVLAILTFFSESHVDEKLHMGDETCNFSTCIIYLPIIYSLEMCWLDALSLMEAKIKVNYSSLLFQKR